MHLTARELKAIEELRDAVFTGLQQFMQELVSTMERFAEMGLQSVARQYAAQEGVSLLANEVKDLEWRIAQREEIIKATSKTSTEIRRSVAEEYEDRLQKTQDKIVEHHMNRLKRIRDKCMAV